MALQPASHNKSQFVQLATSGMLILQTTIVTTVISVFALTNSGWLSVSSASAQEAQPSVPVPGSVSTSAADLIPAPDDSKVTLRADCALAEEMGVQPEHCSSGSEEAQRGLDLESLKKAEEAIEEATSASRIRLLQPSNGMIRLPVMEW